MRVPSQILALASLYTHVGLVDGPPLVAPFSQAEVKDAVDLLDRTSALGLDGLGPTFYQVTWGSVTDDVHAGTACLDGISKAYIVLSLTMRASPPLEPSAPSRSRMATSRSCVGG